MLELLELSGGYSGRDTVQDISVRFPEGQITVIVGENGCGKSTLLKLACGHLPKNSGEILMENQPLSSFSRKEIAQKISYLPQARPIPDITVEALVLHGCFPWLSYPRVYTEKNHAVAATAMQRVGILPLRKKQVAKLSGGERQKTYLAMLLAQNTETLLLDEPTTYLDIHHQLELVELIKSLKVEGKSIVMVLHDLDLALRCADTLAVMQAGKLLQVGTPREILESGAVEQAFRVIVQKEERWSFGMKRPE